MSANQNNSDAQFALACLNLEGGDDEQARQYLEEAEIKVMLMHKLLWVFII
jgi:hypothetical protein